jgi:predicted ester cyclase
MIRAAFPDFHNHVESILAEDNRVAARVQYKGTHRGKIFGIEPTGNQISYAGVGIFTIGAHQLMSAWVLADRYELMRQLVAIPEQRHNGA